MSQVVRPYLQTWEALKKADEKGLPYLSVELPRDKHKSLLQGLRRESARDKAFRFKLIQKGRSFSIGYVQLGDCLQIYFQWKDYVTNAFAGVKKP